MYQNRPKCVKNDVSWSVEPRRHLATRLLNLLLLNLLLLNLLLNYSRGAPFPKGESPSRILGGLSLQQNLVIGGLGYKQYRESMTPSYAVS